MTKAGIYKFWARGGKYKLGARAGKYKLVARAGGQVQGRETQRPFFIKSHNQFFMTCYAFRNHSNFM